MEWQGGPARIAGRPMRWTLVLAPLFWMAAIVVVVAWVRLADLWE